MSLHGFPETCTFFRDDRRLATFQESMRTAGSSSFGARRSAVYSTATSIVCMSLCKSQMGEKASL